MWQAQQRQPGLEAASPRPQPWGGLPPAQPVPPLAEMELRRTPPTALPALLPIANSPFDLARVSYLSKSF